MLLSLSSIIQTGHTATEPVCFSICYYKSYKQNILFRL